MTTPSLTAEDVAFFLRTNPSFFQEHADIFADLRVPHPHEARAISLGERQIMVLRAKAKDLEWKLSGLVNNASGNEKITRTLTAWCARMLAEPDAGKLPGLVVRHLADLFGLPDTTLRLWGIDTRLPDHTTDDVSTETKQWVEALGAPYCGPAKDSLVASWLGPDIQSIAAVPLRRPEAGALLGVLVFGAADGERFTPDMGTAFLEILGELAGAALTRLAPPAP